MKSHEFEQHVAYLLSKGYTMDTLKEWTLADILHASIEERNKEVAASNAR